MSKAKIRGEQKFLMEEFHRGKWKPLMSEDKQRFVVITQDQADSMNKHQNNYKIRYVLAQVDSMENPDEGVFDVDSAKRASLIKFCGDNGIEFTMSMKNDELKAVIKDFQSK